MQLHLVRAVSPMPTSPQLPPGKSGSVLVPPSMGMLPPPQLAGQPLPWGPALTQPSLGRRSTVAAGASVEIPSRVQAHAQSPERLPTQPPRTPSVLRSPSLSRCALALQSPAPRRRTVCEEPLRCTSPLSPGPRRRRGTTFCMKGSTDISAPSVGSSLSTSVGSSTSNLQRAGSEEMSLASNPSKTSIDERSWSSSSPDTFLTTRSRAGSNDTTLPGSSPTLGFREELKRPEKEVASTPSTCSSPKKTTKLVLEVGSHTETGLKPGFPSWQNQDRHLVLPLGKGRMLVAVFDGHGLEGHIVAERVRAYFTSVAPRLIPQAPALLTSGGAAAALNKLFAQAHSYLEQQAQLSELSGTTATVAILDAQGGTMTVAHAGDSTLGIFKDGEVQYVTADHVVDDETERRVLACGGEVRTLPYNGVHAKRIFARGTNVPGLMMSRSLGDSCAHRLGALSVPEVHTDVPLVAGSTVVVASDGVWEKIPAPAVAGSLSALTAVARECPSNMARALVAAAGSRWAPLGTRDDITAVVIGVSEISEDSDSNC